MILTEGHNNSTNNEFATWHAQEWMNFIQIILMIVIPIIGFAYHQIFCR